MKWLGKFFKKLWNAIRKILAVVLIIAAIVIAIWATLITGGAALPLLLGLSSTMMYVVAGLALVGAFIIDDDTSKKVTGQIGDAVGDAAGAVGSVVGSATGGAITGVLGAILDNPVLLVAGIGIMVYFLSDSSSDKPEKRSPDPANVKVRSEGNVNSGVTQRLTDERASSRPPIAAKQKGAADAQAHDLSVLLGVPDVGRKEARVG